jgi:hypothetical protein
MNKAFLIRIGITAVVFWLLDSILMFLFKEDVTLSAQIQESLFKAILFSIIFGLIMRKRWMRKE